MAKTTVADLSDKELASSLNAAKDELYSMRFRHAASQLDNTAQLSTTKRNIARINFEIRRRQISAVEAEGNKK